MKEFGDDWSDKPVRPFDGVFVVIIAYDPRADIRMICCSGSWTKPTPGTTRT